MLVKLTCAHCLSRFKISFMEPHPTSTIYKYCPSCGSTKVVIDQFSTDEYSFEVLANGYKMPTPLVESLYNQWVHDPQKPTPYFKDYIIQQLEALVSNG